jgi:Orotate phosphoribosyltransferase
MAIAGSPTCELWLPDVCFLQPEPHRDLILQLYDIGCVVFGDHVTSIRGAVFPYYIDLRKIISIPQIFHQIVSAYADILKDLKFDSHCWNSLRFLTHSNGFSFADGTPDDFSAQGG